MSKGRVRIHYGPPKQTQMAKSDIVIDVYTGKIYTKFLPGLQESIEGTVYYAGDGTLKPSFQPNETTGHFLVIDGGEF
jgi:hypothetical protein